MLTEKKIRSLCIDEGSYQRGKQLFDSGGVKELDIEEYADGIIEIASSVRGKQKPFYDCSVFLDKDEVDEYSCDCVASQRGMCKHCVALLLAYQHLENDPVKTMMQTTSPSLKDLMEQLKVQAVNLE